MIELIAVAGFIVTAALWVLLLVLFIRLSNAAVRASRALDRIASRLSALTPPTQQNAAQPPYRAGYRVAPPPAAWPAIVDDEGT